MFVCYNNDYSILKGKYMKISQINGTVSINGKVYKGNNLSIAGNKVIIDGVEITDGEVIQAKEIKIEIYGDVNNVETVSADVVVSGNVQNVKTVSGDVKVFGDVTSNIKTISGDIINKKSKEEAPASKKSPHSEPKIDGSTDIFKI